MPPEQCRQQHSKRQRKMPAIGQNLPRRDLFVDAWIDPVATSNQINLRK